MSSMKRPEFTEIGVARIARWTGVMVWLPAVGLACLALYLSLPYEIRQTLPFYPFTKLQLLILCMIANVPVAIYLTFGGHQILNRKRVWGNRFVYWMTSIVLYALTGAGLTIYLAYIIWRDFYHYGFPSYSFWAATITVVIITLSLTCLVMACLSGIALHQHLSTSRGAEKEKEVLT